MFRYANPDKSKSMISVFGSEPETVYVVTSKGLFQKLSLDPEKGLSLFKILVTDGQSDLLVTFFNTKYTAAALKEEETYLFYGRVSGRIGRREMSSPLVFADDPTLPFFPVYPLTEGLSSKMIAANVRQALALTEGLDRDLLPAAIQKANGLCSRREALESIHFPADEAELDAARRRFAFEELFYLSLGLALLRERRSQGRGPAFGERDLEAFYALLPFTLTGAQRRALEEGRALEMVV